MQVVLSFGEAGGGWAAPGVVKEFQRKGRASSERSEKLEKETDLAAPSA